MRIGFAGGGTGGHLFPGIAVAQLARENGTAESVVFFGAERGIESRAVPAAGFELLAEPLEGLVGRSPTGALRAVGRLLGALGRTRREIRRRRLDVMVGLGGYASAAAVLASWSAGVPVVLLEQNRRPGLSNRVLSRLARRVCTSFPAGADSFGPGKAVCTGNPVRSGFERTPHEGRSGLLVFGGSAGARSLNRALLNVFRQMHGQGLELPVILHQSGSHSIDEVQEGYAALRANGARLDVTVSPFIEDMAAAYASARLAVCRAGATTVAELTCTGTPSILVPYPRAAADHQTENARELEEAGAAVLVPDDGELADGLYRALSGLLPDDGALLSMSARAADLGRPDAAKAVLDVLRDLTGSRPRQET